MYATGPYCEQQVLFYTRLPYNLKIHFNIITLYTCTSIATGYGLEGPGIESRWGARFSAPVQTGPGAYPASYTIGTESFPGVKRPEFGVGNPAPSSTQVKERVGLYLYSPYGPS